MIDQYSENQYDDDLTVGAGEYDEYSHTDAVDLFEFSSQDESPTSRLQSLVLSIDWEITDDVLNQFNEELVYLEGMWSGEKINLVYVQALQKIGKYIYQKKANSHPNAIKLLLKLYYNLEKINSSENLSAGQKKDILLEDVKRFENLKRQIAQREQDSRLADSGEEDQGVSDNQQTDENELLNLKAAVLGIDWEITEEDLNELRQEVVILEDKYAGSRPKLILLQGIGTLGAYIKAHKSNAHGDAFKLLYLFFESLEKIVKTPMTLEGEKEILFPAVEKFNSFKTMLVSTAASGDVGKEDEEEKKETEDFGFSEDLKEEIQPALSDFEEEGEGRGFQEEEEANELGPGGFVDVSSHLDEFFGDSFEDVVSQDTEKQTVFDADEEGVEIPVVEAEQSDAVTDNADFAASLLASTDDVTETGDKTSSLISPVDRDIALQGVDVETEADDVSDEEALPLEDSGVFAPALSDGDQASIYSSKVLSAAPTEGSVDEKIIETLDDFFVDEGPAEKAAVETAEETGSKSEYDLEIETDGPAFDLEDEDQIGVEEDEFDEFPSEIDAQLDAFFGREPRFEEPENDVADEEPVIETAPEQEEDIESETEDLSFDIDDQGQSTVEDDLFEEVSSEELLTQVDTDGDGLSSLESEIETEPGEFSDGFEIGSEEQEYAEEEEVVFELVDSFDDEGQVAAAGSQGEEDQDISEHYSDSIDADSEEAALEVSPDPVLAIGQCIKFIDLEFDEKITQRLISEIERLQEHWTSKNLELSFLELLLTVTQHIDRYRFESDPGAYELLKSNYEALELLEGKTLEQNQEMLFEEISKVLKWQQDLLFQQTMPQKVQY